MFRGRYFKFRRAGAQRAEINASTGRNLPNPAKEASMNSGIANGEVRSAGHRQSAKNGTAKLLAFSPISTNRLTTSGYNIGCWL